MTISVTKKNKIRKGDRKLQDREREPVILGWGVRKALQEKRYLSKVGKICEKEHSRSR